ncbi:MAG: AtpZ/AtpI family protein [Planctomycetota bacterium]
MAAALRVGDLGLRLVVTCLLGAFGGYWLDRMFGLLDLFPFLTLFGFFLGLAVGMTALVRGLPAAEGSGSEKSEPEDRKTDG